MIKSAAAVGLAYAYWVNATIGAALLVTWAIVENPEDVLETLRDFKDLL